MVNQVIQGDCLEALKTLPDNSVDSIVTDPPYGLGFMNKEWDSPEEHRRLVEREKQRSEQRFKEGKSPTVAPFSASVRPGLPIKGAKEGKWFQDWCELWAKECYRVLKPGGHLLSFAATRTYHRMAVAIEDAGFEVRDMIEWCYGSGFPKSLNIGKAVDKLQGNEREELGYREDFVKRVRKNGVESKDYVLAGGWKADPTQVGKITKGTSEWEGWGTALKPAHEPICMARKPLAEKTVVENVLKYGTGGINIDESRVESNEIITTHSNGKGNTGDGGIYGHYETVETGNERTGRFPANLLHDNSEEVRECFPETKTGAVKNTVDNGANQPINLGGGLTKERLEDSGNASRFFRAIPNDERKNFKSIIYQAKSSKSDRNGTIEIYWLDGKEIDKSLWEKLNKENEENKYNKEWKRHSISKNNIHPTVKTVALCEYLIKMVTPKGGVVLDPFTGSGSTLIAAKKNGFQYIGIEKEAEYVKIAEARLSGIKIDNKLL